MASIDFSWSGLSSSTISANETKQITLTGKVDDGDISNFTGTPTIVSVSGTSYITFTTITSSFSGDTLSLIFTASAGSTTGVDRTFRISLDGCSLYVNESGVITEVSMPNPAPSSYSYYSISVAAAKSDQDWTIYSGAATAMVYGNTYDIILASSTMTLSNFSFAVTTQGGISLSSYIQVTSQPTYYSSGKYKLQVKVVGCGWSGTYYLYSAALGNYNAKTIATSWTVSKASGVVPTLASYTSTFIYGNTPTIEITNASSLLGTISSSSAETSIITSGDKTYVKIDPVGYDEGETFTITASGDINHNSATSATVTYNSRLAIPTWDFTAAIRSTTPIGSPLSGTSGKFITAAEVPYDELISWFPFERTTPASFFNNYNSTYLTISGIDLPATFPKQARGTYTFNIGVNQSYSYKFYDGTTTKEFSWTIGKKTITIPTQTGTSKTFDGTSIHFFDLSGTCLDNFGNNTSMFDFGHTASSVSELYGSGENYVLDTDTNYFVLITDDNKNTYWSAGYRTYYYMCVTYTANDTIFNAGSYSFTLSVKDSSNMQFSDGSTSITYTYTVNPAYVARPTCNNSISRTYTGSPYAITFSPSTAVTGVTYGGDLNKTNAGSYTATASLTSTTNYRWDNGTTASLSFPWTIAKALVNRPTITAPADLVYSGSAKVITFTNFDSTKMTKTGTYNTAINVGTYVCGVSLIDSSNYSWNESSSGNTSLTYSITNGTVSAISIKYYNHDGNEITAINALTYFKVIINVTKNFTTDVTVTAAIKLNSETETAITLTKSGSSWVYEATSGAGKAGTVTVTATVVGSDNWSAKLNSANLTINKIILSAPTLSANPTYTGAQQSVTATYDTTHIEETSDSVRTGINAGTYTAKFKIKDADSYTYGFSTASTTCSVNWSINKGTFIIYATWYINNGSWVITTDNPISCKLGENSVKASLTFGGTVQAASRPTVTVTGNSAWIITQSGTEYTIASGTITTTTNLVFSAEDTDNYTVTGTSRGIEFLNNSKLVKIYTNDGFKNAIPYIYIDGQWKSCETSIYHNNAWKELTD